MYACGITVYDKCHIGHAMQAIFFDTFRKVLERAGYRVTYVRNYTDVDDKIINRAKQLQISPKDLANEMIEESKEDLIALSISPATYEPRVSEHIPDIIEMISELIDKGYAYPTDEGDVYFKVEKNKSYGKLSNRSIAHQRSGTRDVHSANKCNSLDFALWKNDNTEGACWESPWGTGRPGWHIECSAMARHYLGDSMDIHGGGRDLVFPHHENEIAQSESANGVTYAAIWMHSGLLTINKSKMSKSTGNFITIKQFLNNWPSQVLRLAVLSHHYRSNIDFNNEIFSQARKRLVYYYETLTTASNFLANSLNIRKESKAQISKSLGGQKKFHAAEAIPCDHFDNALCDDFNTPAAIAVINKEMKELNKLLTSTINSKNQSLLVEKISLLYQMVRSMTETLGLVSDDPSQFLQQAKKDILNEIGLNQQTIQLMISERKDAREAKNWQRSDQIRNELLSKGITLKDGPDETTWSIVP